MAEICFPLSVPSTCSLLRRRSFIRGRPCLVRPWEALFFVFFLNLSQRRKPLLGRIQTRTTAWFKSTVVATVLLSVCSVVVCVLAFTEKQRTQRPCNVINPMFWLIHAVTNAVTAVLVLHEKRFAALKHPLSLRVYWVSSFVVTTLFTVSGILHVLSDDSTAAVLKAEDVASFFSFPLTAFLLIASVLGSTGVVTTEGNNNNYSDTTPFRRKPITCLSTPPLRLYPRRSGYG